MARIKRDATSWKAGGVLRRDARHSNDTPEVAPYRKKSRSSKPSHYQVPCIYTEWVEQLPELIVTSDTPPGCASYRPWLRVRTCTVCNRPDRQRPRHNVQTVSVSEAGVHKACDCGESWISRSGMFLKCPADYMITHRWGHYLPPKLELVTLRPGPPPSCLRYQPPLGLGSSEGALPPAWLASWPRQA